MTEISEEKIVGVGRLVKLFLILFTEHKKKFLVDVNQAYCDYGFIRMEDRHSLCLLSKCLFR